MVLVLVLRRPQVYTLSLRTTGSLSLMVGTHNALRITIRVNMSN
jgi:hypothetical protein